MNEIAPRGYEYWRKGLAGEPVEIHADVAHEGFYRMRRGKAWVPVALWWEGERDENGEPDGDETLIAVVGFADGAAQVDPLEIWTFCADKWVTEEAYRQAYSTRRTRPDDAPDPARGIGDNLPEDPLSAIQEELQGEAEIVTQFLQEPITTQEQADRIGPWTKRILAIRQRAEALHKEEKRPILAAGRAVDDKWRTPVSEAQTLCEKLRRHIEPFLKEQKRLDDERRRQAEAEAARLRAEAEAKAKDDASRVELLRQASEHEQDSAPRSIGAGRTGSKVHLRTDKRARIVDIDKCLLSLRDDGDVREIAQKKADRAARAGNPLPGTEIEEIRKAV